MGGLESRLFVCLAARFDGPVGPVAIELDAPYVLCCWGSASWAVRHPVYMGIPFRTGWARLGSRLYMLLPGWIEPEYLVGYLGHP